MAKVNKLVLVRMTLRETLNQLDNRELLCVLTDLYAGGASKDQPRWYGNGSGASGLEQGIYNHMVTFRRVSNLWSKIVCLLGGDKENESKEALKQETYHVRDSVVKILTDRQFDLKQIEAEEPNE